MLRRERHPVHLVGEHAAGVERLGERQAPLVPLLDPALHAAVEPGEDDVDRAGRRARLLEQRCERDARASARYRPPPSATAG